MQPIIKWLLALVIGLVVLSLGIDRLMCNRWIYHDYAAGIDRKMSCFWR